MKKRVQYCMVRQDAGSWGENKFVETVAEQVSEGWEVEGFSVDNGRPWVLMRRTIEDTVKDAKEG